MLTLLVIDERPIRDAAFKAYQMAEGKVATVRAQIEAFETVDLPAFTRWDAQVFGPLMTELREVTSILEAKSHLLAVIDEEMFWTNCSRVTAYRRVMEARNNPSPPPTAPPPEADFDSPGVDDEPIPKVFGASDLPPDFDIDEYDRMSRKQQTKVYEFYEDAASLFEILYGIPAPYFENLLDQERERRHGQETQKERSESSPFEGYIPPLSQPVPQEGGERGRIKELYRTLVRRLHPDLGGAQNTHERDLWQQVQDAYRSRDLEWLEAIHGRLEALHQGGATLPIQILRRMTGDLLGALHGLRSQLSKLRRHPAWRFHEKTAALVKFEAKRRRELEGQLAFYRVELGKIERELASLEQRAARPPKSKKKSKPPARSVGAQDYFRF